MYKSESCNLPALLSPNECQCCVYGCVDVSWFLHSSRLLWDQAQLVQTLPQQIIMHHSLCLQ